MKKGSIKGLDKYFEVVLQKDMHLPSFATVEIQIYSSEPLLLKLKVLLKTRTSTELLQEGRVVFNNWDRQ